jgi:molybdopterin/thiamine biosynthesis adenylyltransferase
MNNINDIRLTGLFKKELGPVTIIGCGAIGSKVAIEIAKTGCPKLQLWDGDEVESHNLCNQAYSALDTATNKALALAHIINSICDMDIDVQPINFLIEENPNTEETVILCVDSMRTRKEIMLYLMTNPSVVSIIETRMGIDEIGIYAFAPIPSNYKRWLECSNYEDGTAEISACGTSLSVGATSAIAAGFATWQYMAYYMEKDIPFGIIIGLAPYGVVICP